jgi:hypothetical protein
MIGKIDLSTERPIPIKAHARTVPGQDGKSIHRMTIGRYCRIGLKGIILESVVIGNQRCTTAEAWSRFVERVTRIVDGPAPVTPAGPINPRRTRKQARAAVKNATNELIEAGA